MGEHVHEQDVRTINRIIGRAVIRMGIHDKGSRIPLYMRALMDHGGYDKVSMTTMITSFFIDMDD